MDSGHENIEGQNEERTNRVVPLPYRLLGKDIVLNYTGGPYIDDQKDPYDIARGLTESREAIFVLDEVSRLGIVVQKIVLGDDGEEELVGPVFIPWGAIHALFEAPADWAEESVRGLSAGSQDEE